MRYKSDDAGSPSGRRGMVILRRYPGPPDRVPVGPASRGSPPSLLQIPRKVTSPVTEPTTTASAHPRLIGLGGPSVCSPVHNVGFISLVHNMHTLCQKYGYTVQSSNQEFKP